MEEGGEQRVVRGKLDDEAVTFETSKGVSVVPSFGAAPGRALDRSTMPGCHAGC